MKRGKYEKRKKRGPLWYHATLLVLIAVFAFSVWYLADYYLNSRQQAQSFDDLAALVDAARPTVPAAPTGSRDPENTRQPNDPSHPDLPDTPPEPAEDQHDENGILLEYAALYEMNPDMAGWLSIEDTRINYPVMHTPDRPDYYLQRSFDGKSSAWGCLYAREECDLATPSDNVTIYGHNMRDGSMFAGLNAYTDKAYWETHRYIRFDTLTEHHVYEIFAVFTTTATLGDGFAYHDFINAEDEIAFDTFIAKCFSHSLYDTGITPAYGDKIICLSTCEYTQENGRLVLAARRIS